jgi:preprotein translocase subunit SecD
MKRVLLAGLTLLIAHAAMATDARGLTIGGVAFSQADVVDARGLPDISGEAVILVTFSRAGAERLAKLTRENITLPVAVAVDGKTISEPVIREEITSGSIQITGGLSLAEAIRMAKLISGKDPLPDDLEDAP